MNISHIVEGILTVIMLCCVILASLAAVLVAEAVSYLRVESIPTGLKVALFMYLGLTFVVATVAIAKKIYALTRS